MKTLLISGANSSYFSYFKGLLSSLKSWHKDQNVDLGLLDGGLDPEQQKWCEEHAITLKPPLPLPRTTEKPSGHPLHEIQYSKPLLPQIFPGYESYLWCDADLWFQDTQALDAMIEGLQYCDLSIVPEIHRAYAHQYDLSFREDEYHANTQI